MPDKDDINEPESERKDESEPEGENESHLGGDLVDITDVMASMRKSNQRRSSRQIDASTTMYSALVLLCQSSIGRY